MKNFVKFGFAILLFIAANRVYGQAPNKVELDSKEYYRHGYNKNGGPYNNPLPSPGEAECRDSVTISSVVKYFVLPDPTISPNYKYTSQAEIMTVSNLNSTFGWSLYQGTTLGTLSSSTTNIIEVTWKGIGIDSVKVKETPKVSTSCAGKETVIPVAVIDKPTFTFGVGPGTTSYVDGGCFTKDEIDAKVSYPFPINTSSTSSQLIITYSIKKDGADMLTNQTMSVAKGNSSVSFEFSDYGVYEITISNISDRISRKSVVDGEVAVAGAKFTYNVLKQATTGPIYRLPNNF